MQCLLLNLIYWRQHLSGSNQQTVIPNNNSIDHADRPVETSIETQTEAFMDRPSSPLFVPAKSGVDADTQVVVGELFDFDLEVLNANAYSLVSENHASPVRAWLLP